MSILDRFLGKKINPDEKSKGKTCHMCGAINPLEVKFCSACGSEFHIVLDTFDAFISYRRDTGSELASLLKLHLESRFHKSVFLDINELQVGRFDEELLNRIEITPNFILILSRGSLDRCANKSDWLKREIMHALETGRNIVPVMTDGFIFPSEELWALLPPEMGVLPSLNGINYSHIHQDSAIRKIASYLKNESDIHKPMPGRGICDKVPGGITKENKGLIIDNVTVNKDQKNTNVSINELSGMPEKNSGPIINLGSPRSYTGKIPGIHEAFRSKYGSMTSPGTENASDPMLTGPAKQDINWKTIIPDKQEVSGTWEVKDSPVYIQGEAIVPEGKTLNINPGVLVIFHTGLNIDYLKPNFDKGFLRVNGRLTACGTITDNICFRGDIPDRWKSWGSIILHTADSDSKLSYCTFEQSYCVQNALTVKGIGKFFQVNFQGAVSLYKSSAVIENCIFVNNTYCAVSCDRSSPVITGTSIINDGNNPSATFAGISCRDMSFPRIVNCTIVCKKGRGILSYSSIPVIENSIIIAEDSGKSRAYPQTRALISHSLLKVRGSEDIYVDDGGNILDEDPQFIDRECGDFHLKSTSPCISSGRDHTDMGAFPYTSQVLGAIPKIIDDKNYEHFTKEFTSNPVEATIELNSGDKLRLTGFLIRDHGAPVNTMMLSEVFDMNAIVSLKDIADIQRISEDSLEIKLVNGGRKSWKLAGRGVTGVDATSGIPREINFIDLKNVTISFNLQNIIKGPRGLKSGL